MPPQDTMPPAPAFLPSPVKFDDGTIVYPLKALTDYRICHEGRPHEARIVYTCTTTPPSPSASASASASSASSPSQSDSESEPIATHILKIKVQIPGPNHNDGEPTSPSKGPSDTTSLELKALQTFHDVDAKFAPQLLGHASIVQGEADPLPGGYVNYVLMNQMRGETLFDSGFWGRGEEERAEISEKFLESLRAIYKMGMQPLDRALRNIMWDPETKTCSIIDFEMWRATDGSIPDETKELQRWGLARSPPQKWWETWFEAERG